MVFIILAETFFIFLRTCLFFCESNVLRCLHLADFKAFPPQVQFWFWSEVPFSKNGMYSCF